MKTPQAVLDLIEKAYEEQAVFLDLGAQGLREIPKEITRLAPWLKGLNLGSNYAVEGKNQAAMGNIGPNKFNNPVSLTILQELPQLAELHLCDCEIGPQGAKSLSLLSGLHTLNVSGNEIRAQGAKSLSLLSGLHTLNVSDNQIRAQGAESLSRLSGLHSLNIGGNKIGPQGAKSLSLLSGLHTLDVARNLIGAQGAESLSLLSGLHTLDVSSNQIGARGAESLSRLSGLHTLNVVFNQIGDQGAESLSRLSGLHTLNISRNEIRAEGAESLSSLRSLHTLNVGLNQIGAEGAESLSRLRALHTLDVTRNYIGAQGAESLSRLSALHTLNVAGNYIQAQGAESLSHLSGLHTLDVSSNQIGDQGVESLSRLSGLHTLNVGNNGIGAQGAESLSRLSGLHTLDVGTNRIGDRGAESLSRLSALHTLDVARNLIGAQGAESLSRLSGLHTLYVGTNMIGDQGAESLSRLSGLHTLDVSGNQIGDQGAESLSLLRGLHTLKVNSNNIERLDWLTKLTELNEVWLYDNPLEKTYQVELIKYDNNLHEIAPILARLEEKNKIRIQLPAKVLQLGNHAAGKSSFLHHLQTGELKKQSSTHLLKVEAYPKTSKSKEGEKVRLPDAVFYDFGGQDYYHGLYRAFITPGALTLLFVDADNNQNKPRTDSGGLETLDFNLDYWLGQKHHQDGDDKKPEERDPVLLIETHADLRSRPADFQLETFPEVLNRFFISLHPNGNNAKNQAALAYLKAHLDALIQERRVEREEPKWYEDFLNYLIREEAKGNCEATDLMEVLKKYTPQDENNRLEYLKTELDQFCKQGMVLYYKDIAPDKVWLSPEAFVAYVHNHVLKKDDEALKTGRISVSVFEKKEIPKEMLAILEKQKVIFYHEYGDEGGAEYILPNFLPLAHSSQAEYDLFTFGLANPAFVLHFQDFLPLGLINQMICFFGRQPDRKKFWRNQMVFTLEQKMKVLVQLDFSQLEIKVFTSLKKENEDQEQKLKSYLFYCIMGLYWDQEPEDIQSFEKFSQPYSNPLDEHAFFDKLDSRGRTYYRQGKSYPKDLFVSVDNQHFICLKTLEESIQESRIEAFRKESDGRVGGKSYHIPIGPFQIFTSKKLSIQKKVMISYSKDDLAQVHRFRDALVPLVDAGLIGTPWYCTLLEAGSGWQEEIQTHLREADIVFFMCSISFIRTEYIREQEIKVAKAQQKENPAKIIIPIVLNYCEWEAYLGEYTALPYIAKPVSSFAPNTDIAWYLCTRAIRNMLTNSQYEKAAELEKMVKQLYEEIVEGKKPGSKV